MLIPTHMFFAVALAYILKLPRIPALIGGFLLDLDVIFYLTGLGFPFIHRGITHTAIFIITVSAIIYLVSRKRDHSCSFALGAFSHLSLDMITGGVMLLYPLGIFFEYSLVSYNNIFANVGICLLSAVVFLLYYSRPDLIETRNQRIVLFAAVVLLSLLIYYAGAFTPYTIL